jgi:hypothetical protein
VTSDDVGQDVLCRGFWFEMSCRRSRGDWCSVRKWSRGVLQRKLGKQAFAVGIRRPGVLQMISARPRDCESAHLVKITLCRMLKPPGNSERLIIPGPNMLNAQRRHTSLGALCDMTPAGEAFVVVPRDDTLVLEIGVEFFVQDCAVDRRQAGVVVGERSGSEDSCGGLEAGRSSRLGRCVEGLGRALERW